MRLVSKQRADVYDCVDEFLVFLEKLGLRSCTVEAIDDEKLEKFIGDTEELWSENRIKNGQ
jgi:hypothetical protein